MLNKLLRSPVWKKVLTGITGLGLTGFVLMHMVGNLSLLTSDQAYNEYAEFLTGFGPLFYAVELGLLAFFVFHAVVGINIAIGKRRARPRGYLSYKSAGSPSRQTLASRSMIVTGMILLAFLVLHLITFKYGPGGPGNANGAFVVSYDGGPEIRDLAKLVRQKFALAPYAFGYTAIMALLVLHLRHGVWSAVQSLAAMKPSISPLIYTLGGLLGAGIGIGFILVPLGLYFNLV